MKEKYLNPYYIQLKKREVESLYKAAKYRSISISDGYGLSDKEVLESMDIKVIEKFLREKKLENLNK